MHTCNNSDDDGKANGNSDDICPSDSNMNRHDFNTEELHDFLPPPPPVAGSGGEPAMTVRQSCGTTQTTVTSSRRAVLGRNEFEACLQRARLTPIPRGEGHAAWKVPAATGLQSWAAPSMSAAAVGRHSAGCLRPVENLQAARPNTMFFSLAKIPQDP
ncbi:hypothetical protein V8F20_003891 [Naviculisporaceae sp. PSN 640]